MEALGRALDEVVRRHEVLRTAFEEDGSGGVRARVLPPHPLELPLEDLTTLAPGDREREARRLLDADARAPLAPERGEVVRALLVRRADDDHELQLTFHHLVFDGGSTAVLYHELGVLYAAFLDGRPSPLPEPELQYADVARWQRRRADEGAFDEELDHWRERLEGAPPRLDLPFPPARRAGAEHGADRWRFDLPAEVTGSVRSLARSERATPSMVLLAAWQLLLARYAGVDEVVVGMPAAGRVDAGLGGVVGDVANVLPIRVRLDGEPSFRALLARVRQAALDAFDHQAVPLGLLARRREGGRAGGSPALFQALFNFRNYARTAPELPGLEVTVSTATVGLPVELSLDVTDPGEGAPTCELEYATDRYDEGTVARMAGHLLVLLEAALAEPDTPVHRLPLLTAPEREAILGRWAGTEAPYPAERTVHELFAEQARAEPGATALISGDRRMTYGELALRATAVARKLRAAGVEPGTRVGLLAERSPELVVGMVAILEAGGAYVPLDPGYPGTRLAGMLEDAQISVILAGRPWADRVADPSRPVVWLEDVGAPTTPDDSPPHGRRPRNEGGPDPGDPPTPPARVDPGAPAYVMYTSGSTGRPKGVVVPHRAVVRLVCGTDYVRFDPSRVFLHVAPPSFDAATFEVWGALLNGAPVVIAPPGPEALDRLGALIRDHGVTTLFLTSALFHRIARSHPESLAGVEELLTGGDVVSPEACGRILATLPGCRLLAAYGPTEATTFTTTHPVDAGDVARGRIPLGRPIPNTRVRVLDPHDRPVPVGVPGELLVGGPGVALGYLDRPALTAERFIADPFVEDGGDRGRAGVGRDEGGDGEGASIREGARARLYRTGDRVRWRDDGVLEFLGRSDRQVKVRGFRIEPGEIETALVALPGVRDAALLTPRIPEGDVRLVACVVPEPGRGTSPAALRRRLEDALPAWMVPGRWVLLDALPVGPTGKVDRERLAALAETEGVSPGDEAPDGVGPAAAVPPTREPDPAPPRPVPRNPVQRELVEVWEEVLGVSPVGLHDDFFELGGHSLLALTMIDRVEARLGIRPSLAALFEAPTVEHLARVLGDTVEPDPGGIRCLREGAPGRTPFFYLHGDLNGVGLYCRRLFRDMDPDVPVYLLHPWAPEADADVEVMAAGFLDRVLEIQRRGPYRIGGYCNGAAVAVELAHRLEARDERVDLLALIEAGEWNAALAPWTEWITRIGTRLGMPERPLRLGTMALRPLAISVVRRRPVVPPVLLGLYRRLTASPEARARRRARAGERWVKARPSILRWIPRPLQATLHLLCCESNADRPGDPHNEDWRAVSPDVRLHRLPGSHITILTEHVHVLGRALDELVRATEAARAVATPREASGGPDA